MMLKNNFAVGQCLCGGIKYILNSEPLNMGQCHCNDCKKSTGTGHASFAFFNQEDVEVEGKTASYASKTDSGSTITRYFCSVCGSSVFAVNSSSKNIMGVAVGTIEDSSWFKPAFIVYSKRKPSWDFMNESVPTFEEMPT